MSPNQTEAVTITEAYRRLGVSRSTLWRIIKQYDIEVIPDVLDTRIKRVRVADIQRVVDDAERARRGIAA
jgi:predicted DNA-binding protein (UPF0251 family)